MNILEDELAFALVPQLLLVGIIKTLTFGLLKMLVYAFYKIKMVLLSV